MADRSKNVPMVRAVALLLPLSCAACATSVGSSASHSGVIVASEDAVKACKFLGDIHGVSPFYGIFAAPALASSREAAMQQAKNLGASHVTWANANTNYGSTSISGNAYKCD